MKLQIVTFHTDNQQNFVHRTEIDGRDFISKIPHGRRRSRKGSEVELIIHINFLFVKLNYIILN